MYHLIPNAIVAALLSNAVAAAPVHAASCTVDHQPASIARAVPVDAPLMAKLQRLTGTSVIRVDLADDGSVVGTYVATSSGSALLDRSAIETAKQMIYAPETRGCAPVSGSYAVEVEYTD